MFGSIQRLTIHAVIVAFAGLISAVYQPFGAILGMSVAEDAFPGVWPMSGVVASALMNTPVLRDAVNILGVREAGTASIMKMFEDGFQVNM